MKKCEVVLGKKQVDITARTYTGPDLSMFGIYSRSTGYVGVFMSALGWDYAMPCRYHPIGRFPVNLAISPFDIVLFIFVMNYSN
jgi:hypothetical protein